MTTSAILFGAGLALAVAYYIARPFHRRRALPGSTWNSNERHQLLEKKAAIYAAIREIDTDVAVGKLDPVDHRALRQRYVAEGIAVLKALDALSPGDSIDRAIEKDVALLRDQKPIDIDGRFCPSCGTPTERGDHFCARCGARLAG